MYFKWTLLRRERCTTTNFLWNKVTKSFSIFHLWYKFQLMPFAKAYLRGKNEKQCYRVLQRTISMVFTVRTYLSEGQAESERTLPYFVTLLPVPYFFGYVCDVDSIEMKRYQNLPELSHLQRTSFFFFILTCEWQAVELFAWLCTFNVQRRSYLVNMSILADWWLKQWDKGKKKLLERMTGCHAK